MPERPMQVQESDSRNNDPKHIALVAAIAEKRACIGPVPCGRGIPEFGGRDAACDCETTANAYLVAIHLAAEALADVLVDYDVPAKRIVAEFRQTVGVHMGAK